jgi:hypothetical protein
MTKKSIFGSVELMLALAAGLASIFAIPSFAGDSYEHRVRYKLIDIGGFGGPGSFLPNGFDGILNNHGLLVGWADTAKPDPFPDFCASPDCIVSHAFLFHHGEAKDLGALRKGFSSEAFWIAPNGLVAGNSQNGKTDPLVPGFPEIRAVLWRDPVRARLLRPIQRCTRGGTHNRNTETVEGTKQQSKAWIDPPHSLFCRRRVAAVKRQ